MTPISELTAIGADSRNPEPIAPPLDLTAAALDSTDDLEPVDCTCPDCGHANPLTLCPCEIAAIIRCHRADIQNRITVLEEMRRWVQDVAARQALTIEINALGVQLQQLGEVQP